MPGQSLPPRVFIHEVAPRDGLQIFKRGPWPGHCVAPMRLNASQLFEREHPAAQRNARARDAGSSPGNRHGDASRIRFFQGRHHPGLIGRYDGALGVAPEAGGVLQVPRGDRGGLPGDSSSTLPESPA